MAGLGLTGAAILGCSNNEGSEVEGTLGRARKAGVLRVGFADAPPYGFSTASGEVSGEAIVVARAVLAELGIPKLDPVLVPFGSLIPALQAGRFDMIAAGMFITAARCQQVLMSDPDYCIQLAFIVPSGNPYELGTYETVAANSNIRIGIITGGLEESYAFAAGVSDDQLVRFASNADMVEGLQARRVDAVTTGTLPLRVELDRLNDPGLELTEPFTPVVDGKPARGCGAYVFRQDDGELHAAFNEVLNQMQEDRKILPLVEEFGLTEAEIGPARDVTAEELCATS